MKRPRTGTKVGGGVLLVRFLCLLVAISPLIAAAVAAPVVDLSPPAPVRTPPAVTPPPAGLDPVAEDRAAEAERAAERRVADRLDALAAGTHFAVSMLDEKTGRTFHHGSGRFQTASLVKIHFSALMLLQADTSGIALTGSQRDDIEQMLVRSENEPALRAYQALGGPTAIERSLAREFGQGRVDIGESTFWGSSSTRPRDVVAMLRIVLSTDRGASGRYALLQDSMARVIPEQQWGVTALADDDSRPQVKVGFVESSTGWVVNSSGRVRVDGRPVLLSVMTDGNASLEAGIATIEDVVRPLRQVVRAQREHAEVVSRGQARPERCLSARPPTSPC